MTGARASTTQLPSPAWSVLTGSEPTPRVPSQGAANGTPADTLEAQVALAAAQARIDGLEALVQQQRERQGMSDSLNQRLKEAHTSATGSTGTARHQRDEPKLVAILADELTATSS